MALSSRRHTATEYYCTLAVHKPGPFINRMRKPVLLVAEDNDFDAQLLERLLDRCGGKFQFHRVANGEATIEYLTGAGAYADRTQHPLPNLLLLDLKMPRKDGFAVLQWRLEQGASVWLPAIVFSSSSLSGDVARAYQLGANAYIVKSTQPKHFERFVHALHDWWIGFNVTNPPPT